MNTIRVFVILALMISTAQLSHGWKVQFIDILKKMVTVLPIPYSSNIDLMCSGQDAELWLQASGTLDKDSNILNGVDPALNNIDFSINVSNFKIPVKGRYNCKISFLTFTSHNLLLLNLTGSSFDITKFFTDDFMKTIFSSFFEGSSGITYNTHWSLNPSTVTATNVDNLPRKDYSITNLYSIINELAQAILHLPRKLMTNILDVDSLKKNMFGSGFRKATAPNKQGHILRNNRIHISEKAPTTDEYFTDKSDYHSRRQRTTSSQTDVNNLNIKGTRRVTEGVPGVKIANSSYGYHIDQDMSNKEFESAALLLSKDEEQENNSDDVRNRRQHNAIIVAAGLFSLGVVVFISNVIIGFVVYNKYIKVRNSQHNIENGLNERPTPHIVLQKARTGPNGVRLTNSRSRGRIHSAPLTRHVPSTPYVNMIVVKPQQDGSVEPKRLNCHKSFVSEGKNGDSLPNHLPNNDCNLKLSESRTDLRNLNNSSQCMPSNSEENHSAYSHIFHGKHLNTMRRVSSESQLSYQNNALDTTKATVIYVKPVDMQ